MEIRLDPQILPNSTFACGPGQGHPLLRHTPLYQTCFERSHRALDLTTEGLYKNVTLALKELLAIPADYTVAFFPGGGSPAVDAVLWSLTKDTLSGLAFGAFSNRWSQQMSQQLGSQVVSSVRTLQPGELFPQELPDYTASLVVLTPNETSSGVQIPNDYLEQGWNNRGKDTLIAWDTTSCAGGRLLPPNAYDINIFSLQKCFGAAGGTSVMVLSPKAVERIAETKKYRSVPYTLDLTHVVENARKFQTFNTPNTINIWLCYEACKWMLDNGGLTAMDKLCRAHAQHLFDWAEKTDWVRPYVADTNFRSYTTPTFEITNPHISANDINAALAATGKPNLQDGVKRFSTAPENTLRIACFPFVDINGVSEYQKLTATLDEIVRQLRS